LIITLKDFGFLPKPFSNKNHLTNPPLTYIRQVEDFAMRKNTFSTMELVKTEIQPGSSSIINPVSHNNSSPDRYDEPLDVISKMNPGKVLDVALKELADDVGVHAISKEFDNLVEKGPVLDRFGYHVENTIPKVVDNSKKTYVRTKRAMKALDINPVDDATVKELDDSLVVGKGGLIEEKGLKDIFGKAKGKAEMAMFNLRSLALGPSKAEKSSIKDVLKRVKTDVDGKIIDSPVDYHVVRDVFKEMKELDDSLLVEKTYNKELPVSNFRAKGILADIGSKIAPLADDVVLAAYNANNAKKKVKVEKGYVPSPHSKRMALAKRNIANTAANGQNAKLDYSKKPEQFGAKELSDSLIVEKGLADVTERTLQYLNNTPVKEAVHNAVQKVKNVFKPKKTPQNPNLKDWFSKREGISTQVSDPKLPDTAALAKERAKKDSRFALGAATVAAPVTGAAYLSRRFPDVEEHLTTQNHKGKLTEKSWKENAAYGTLGVGSGFVGSHIANKLQDKRDVAGKAAEQDAQIGAWQATVDQDKRRLWRKHEAKKRQESVLTQKAWKKVLTYGGGGLGTGFLTSHAANLLQDRRITPVDDESVPMDKNPAYHGGYVGVLDGIKNNEELAKARRGKKNSKIS
jgi:hypothetical protein